MKCDYNGSVEGGKGMTKGVRRGEVARELHTASWVDGKEAEVMSIVKWGHKWCFVYTACPYKPFRTIVQIFCIILLGLILLNGHCHF